MFGMPVVLGGWVQQCDDHVVVVGGMAVGAQASE